MHTAGFTIIDNVTVPEKVSTQNLFEKRYLELRSKEQRVYSDEALLRLPEVAPDHPYYSEWQHRKRSAEKLVQWLGKKKQPLRILEVGCGNGWLARQLTAVPDSKVIGSDINFTELQQAAKVYSSVPGLHFIYGDIRHGLFKEMEFDCVIFAASIQYFPSLHGIISTALSLLKTGGEVHILDSPFYRQGDVMAAQKRTASYYTDLGFPEMIPHYYHHTWDALESFDHELLYDPSSLQLFFSKNKNPFPWICIRSAAKVV
ncbi:MAG: class I SAM-dependent methyltransferase [Chitinophagaceae bacterium]